MTYQTYPYNAGFLILKVCRCSSKRTELSTEWWENSSPAVTSSHHLTLYKRRLLNITQNRERVHSFRIMDVHDRPSIWTLKSYVSHITAISTHKPRPWSCKSPLMLVQIEFQTFSSTSYDICMVYMLSFSL